ncbi:MAG: ComF family protein [Candidatus Omnitrophota bacterium]
MKTNYCNALINLFFPNLCLFDGRRINDKEIPCVCGSCLKKINFISSFVCSKCGSPMHNHKYSDDIIVGDLKFTCKKCAENKFWFRFLRSACYYEGITRDCIRLFKYKQKFALKKICALLLMYAFRTHFARETYDLIMAVPMHPLKKFIREYNHSEVLAKEFSFIAGIHYAGRNLKRIKITKSQTGLNSINRKRNVQNAFSVSSREEIRGKKILLIDDVATTLNTANECAKTLFKNGAEFIDVLTIARG